MEKFLSFYLFWPWYFWRLLLAGHQQEAQGVRMSHDQWYHLESFIWLKCCQPGFSSSTSVIINYLVGTYFKTLQISCISSFHPPFWHPSTMLGVKWKFPSYIIPPTFINWDFTIRKSCPFPFYTQRYIFVSGQSHK